MVELGRPARLRRLARVGEIQRGLEGGPGERGTSKQLALGLDADHSLGTKRDLGAERDDAGNRPAWEALLEDLLLPLLLPLGEGIDTDIEANVHVAADANGRLLDAAQGRSVDSTSRLDGTPDATVNAVELNARLRLSLPEEVADHVIENRLAS